MLRELENEVKKLKGIKTAFLTTFGNNESAIRLYKKFGYKETGRIPAILRHRGKLVDEVYMYKHI